MSLFSFHRPGKTDSRRAPTPRRRARGRLEIEALEERTVPTCNMVSGFVYHDVNNNGLYEAGLGEAPIANSQIELRNAQGTVVGSTVTDANGHYSFSRDSTVGTSPLTITHALSFPSTLTDYALEGTVPQFDPELGTLLAVDVVNTGSISTDLKVENLSTTSPSTISGVVSGNLHLTGPNVDLTTSPSRHAGSFEAPVFDGTLDFGGASGSTLPTFTAADSQSMRLTGDAMNPFVGIGSVSLRETAQATSTTTGGGNLAAVIASRAEATVLVAYRYIPSDCLRPGDYTIVQTPQPAGWIDGKEARGAEVLGNPPGVDVIPVTLNGQDLNDNNFGELRQSVLPPPTPPGAPPRADLAIVKTASASPVPVGSAVNYTLTVSNLGPDRAELVTIQDTLPAGVTFVSAAPAAGWQGSQNASVVTFTTGALDAGASASFTISILAPASPGTIVNTAVVSSNTPDDNPSNNTSTASVQVLGGNLPTVVSQQSFATTPSNFPTDVPVLGKVSLFTSSGIPQTDPALVQQIAYVDGMYRTLLGREADTASLIFWVRHLRAGGGRAALVHALWAHPEHRNQQIQTYYRAFLHRDADAAGFAYWNGVFAAGASETDVAVAILTSQEYTGAHAGAAEFIDGLYRDVLGRPSDTVGQQYWSGVLATSNRATVARALLLSDESNSRAVGQIYGNYLHRGLTQEELAFWLGMMRAGPPQQVSLLVLTSDELYNLARR